MVSINQQPFDRFFMRLSLGYMNRAQELSVLSRGPTVDIIESLKCEVTEEETEYVKSHVRDVEMTRDVQGYLMDLVEKTRREALFACGVSTRGAIALYRATQARAALQGRDYALPEDIRHVAPHVLGHRIGVAGGTRRQESENSLQRMIGEIPVPLETKS